MGLTCNRVFVWGASHSLLLEESAEESCDVRACLHLQPTDVLTGKNNLFYPQIVGVNVVFQSHLEVLSNFLINKEIMSFTKWKSFITVKS